VEPVLSDTPRDQGNVLDCTGCQNTQVLFQLTEMLWDHKFLSDVTGCRKTQVSDCTNSTVYCINYVTRDVRFYKLKNLLLSVKGNMIKYRSFEFGVLL